MLQRHALIRLLAKHVTQGRKNTELFRRESDLSIFIRDYGRRCDIDVKCNLPYMSKIDL